MTAPVHNLSAIFCLSLCAVMACGCARNPPPATAAPSVVASPVPRKVRLQTDWLPQAEHGGFYQALVKGYYAAAGLEVDILSGGPGISIRPQVATGAVEFGMNRSDDTLTAVDSGLPLVIVGAFFQHDHLGLLLHADDPAKAFADLGGRTITAMPGLAWIQFVQKKYAISLQLRPTTPGLTSFFSDRTEIRQCLVTSEPFFATRQGVPVRTLSIAESGYDAYHILITGRAFMREHPAAVRAFMAATRRQRTRKFCDATEI
jgi:NitT/TauT family transport system substrate-binding protein